MEEFRSTEILDKEIQEDARRKAERLLRNVEADGKRIIAETASRVEGIRTEKKKEYAGRLGAYKADLDAALPLEKGRFLVSFIDKSLKEAVSFYVESLSEEKKGSLILDLLERYKTVLENAGLQIDYYGFSEAAVKKFLTAIHIEKNVEKITELSSTRTQNAGMQFGMRISVKGKVCCRVTIEELIDELLDTKRFELADALFAGRLQQ